MNNITLRFQDFTISNSISPLERNNSKLISKRRYLLGRSLFVYCAIFELNAKGYILKASVDLILVNTVTLNELRRYSNSVGSGRFNDLFK